MPNRHYTKDQRSISQLQSDLWLAKVKTWIQHQAGSTLQIDYQCLQDALSTLQSDFRLPYVSFYLFNMRRALRRHLNLRSSSTVAHMVRVVILGTLFDIRPNHLRTYKSSTRKENHIGSMVSRILFQIQKKLTNL